MIDGGDVREKQTLCEKLHTWPWHGCRSALWKAQTVYLHQQRGCWWRSCRLFPNDHYQHSFAFFFTPLLLFSFGCFLLIPSHSLFIKISSLHVTYQFLFFFPNLPSSFPVILNQTSLKIASIPHWLRWYEAPKTSALQYKRLVFTYSLSRLGLVFVLFLFYLWFTPQSLRQDPRLVQLVPNDCNFQH